ncbi:MAG: PIN domain-containing protein [Caldilineaceae bacterium]|nr:PIN domain-containing protein [Caldilineaceae bacterium]
MNEIDRLQFVDTNLLVYAYDETAGNKHVQAAELMAALWESGTGCLSIQVLQEFFVNITRKVPQPLALPAAAQIIADLSVWHVHCPTTEDVLAAIQLQQRHGLAFWDAMILNSASQLGCTVLWSEDFSPGRQYDQTVVRTPFSL